MKDQILAIEPHDDLALLRDRILRAQGDRILLHLAPAAILRRLEIVLACRWAQQIGAQLIIVTGEALTTREALKSGVVCRATIDEALTLPLQPPVSTMKSPRTPDASGPKSSRDGGKIGDEEGARSVATRMRRENAARRPSRAGSSPLVPGRLARLVFAAPIALLGVAAILLIPKARIVIELPVREEQLSLSIDDSILSEVSTEISVTRSAGTSGRVYMPTTSAAGELTLINRGESLLAIPAGTRFRDTVSGVEFEALVGAWLDPRATALVMIRAATPGPRGNIAAGRIREATGLPAQRLEVQQLSPTSGGQSEWRAAVTAADLRALRDSAEAELAIRARDGLAAEAANRGQTLIEQSLLISDRTELTSAPAGTAVDSVTLTLSARVAARAVAILDLQVLARKAAEGRAQGQSVILPSAEEIRVDQGPQGQPRIQFGLVSYGASLTSDVLHNLRLRTRSGARAIIESLLPESQVQIEASPAWWPLMPAFPSRFEIVVAPDRESSSVVR